MKNLQEPTPSEIASAIARHLGILFRDEESHNVIKHEALTSYLNVGGSGILNKTLAEFMALVYYERAQAWYRYNIEGQ